MASGWLIAGCALAVAAGIGCSEAREAKPTAVALNSAAASPSASASSALRCADHSPQRNAYFGELHVHTRHSMDANTWDVRATPDDAYRFARGEVIAFAPYDADGNPSRKIRLERPLDFASVTDHASYLGPVSACTRPGSPSYDAPGCRTFRGEGIALSSLFGELGARMAGFVEAPLVDADGQPSLIQRATFSEAVCGEAQGVCDAEMRTVWRETQEAAERANEPCRFSAFKGYEYTATPDLSKVHRNVIFKNARVPEIPISWMAEPREQRLWERLAAECSDSGNGCDAITIPHNSNLSNGRLFTIGYKDEPLHVQVAQAGLRQRMEPLVEISQIKGDSECRNGFAGVVGAYDELCDYEKLRTVWGVTEDCADGETGKGALAGQGCQSRVDFVRYALVEGLREAERIGVNPIKLGITASTDTHNANPGDTNERSYDGWSGKNDATPELRLGGGAAAVGQRFGLVSSPGGLMGVWAEENTRDSLFAGMRRRETFGTSGPRIQPRMFAGWQIPEAICEGADFVKRGYTNGVPMGSDLPVRPNDAHAPTIAISALRDPGSADEPGGLLQRIQIVKGWVGDDALFHQAVYDVTGKHDNGASVDPGSCAPNGPGYDELCAVWSDPDFDPGRHAVYYARVVENPSCRWNAWECLRLPADQRPASCSDPNVPKLIQERAWTSPVWYEPTAEGS